MTSTKKHCLAFAGFSLLTFMSPSYGGDFLGDLINQTLSNATQGKSNGLDQALRAVTSGDASAPTSRSTGNSSPDNRPSTSGTGTPFYGEYIADYWKQPGASTRGDTPSTDALGRMLVSKVNFSGKTNHPGAQGLRQKLERILAKVLPHPAINPARGASLTVSGLLGHGDMSPIGRILPGSVSINAYSIFLDSPNTRQYPDGTYITTGNEADSLRIEINDPGVLTDRMHAGTYNGIDLFRRGSGYMLLINNTSRPSTIPGRGNSAPVGNPDILDPNRPLDDIQIMTIYVGTSSNIWSDAARKKLKPTSTPGRLIGVMFSTDWASILDEVNR